MNDAIVIIREMIREDDFQKVTFSGSRVSNEIKSIIASSISSPDELKLEYRLEKHNDIKSVKKEVFFAELEDHLKIFKQVLVKTSEQDVQILLNKKLKSKIIRKKTEGLVKSKHNREKNYLIPDGTPCSFLEYIGVMDNKGRVKSNFYKKFRQINRFLELVDDLYKNETLTSFHAVDFGCGKSYLTFALYHYFSFIKKIDVLITGIDLKQEVIDHCNDIAKKVGFTGLQFEHGFIHDFKTDKDIDFVVTLHACDTATDDAILFSLKNKASKMMFVPCCQHELNKQLKNYPNSIMLKHGIFRDRICALVTDTMRTQLLEACGFKVQSMEFIDLEHTAKNVLLRCSQVSRTSEQTQEIINKYLSFRSEWNISPYLEHEMSKIGFIELDE